MTRCSNGTMDGSDIEVIY